MKSIADKSTTSYYKEPHLCWEVPELLLGIEQGSPLAAASTCTCSSAPALTSTFSWSYSQGINVYHMRN